MTEIFTAAALWEIIKVLGLPGCIFVIWYLSHRAEITSRAEDRKEHMAKWDSLNEQHRADTDHLVKQHLSQTGQLVTLYSDQMGQILKNHYEENQRTIKVIERHADALEAQHHVLSLVQAQISTNQWCPINRNGSKGEPAR